MLNTVHKHHYAALAVVALTTSALAGPLIHPISIAQDRYHNECLVSVGEDSWHDFNWIVISATNLGPFEESFELMVEGPNGAYASSGVSQTSIISDSTISVTGSTFSTFREGSGDDAWGRADGILRFHFSFHVRKDARYTLDVFRAAFETGETHVEFLDVYDDDVITITTPSNEELTDVYQGVIPSGRYTLRVSSTSDASVAWANEVDSYDGFSEVDLMMTFTCYRPEDLVVDEKVDVNDLLALFAAWGPCPSPCAADLVEPFGVVDANDLLALFAAWGDC